MALALLFGTSGSFAAQENDPPIVIEFEPIENAEFFEVIEPGSADVADLLGVDFAEDAFAVNFAAAIDLDWETNGGLVDLGGYDIQYGDYHLLYVTIVPIGALDIPSFNMIAGQSISVSIVPWLHTNPDAPMWESGFVHDWNLIPGFEGIQYASNDESILRVQFYQADIAAGKQNPTSVWLSGTREGTAMVQLVLPDEIIIQQNVVVLPRPPSFPRPEDYLATPHAPRVTAGQSVVTAIANEPEDSGLLAPQVIDWASSDPSVAVIDGAVVFDDLGEPVFGTEKNGKRELSIKGLKAGKAVITVALATYSTSGVPVAMGYYWLDVTVTDGGGGDVPIARASSFLDYILVPMRFVGSFFLGCRLGALNQSDWISDDNKIGRWGAKTSDIPRTIYYRQISTGDNLDLQTAVQHAANQWNAAFGLTGSNRMTIQSFSGSPPSDAKIIFYGGITSELETIFGSGKVNSNGGCDQNSIFEGLWTYGNSTKEGRLMTKAPCWVRRNSNFTQDHYNNVATHELGHALGWMGHSSTKGHVMYVRNLTDGYSTALKTAEIKHLQQAYNG